MRFAMHATNQLSGGVGGNDMDDASASAFCLVQLQQEINTLPIL